MVGKRNRSLKLALLLAVTLSLTLFGIVLSGRKSSQGDSLAMSQQFAPFLIGFDQEIVKVTTNGVETDCLVYRGVYRKPIEEVNQTLQKELSVRGYQKSNLPIDNWVTWQKLGGDTISTIPGDRRTIPATGTAATTTILFERRARFLDRLELLLPKAWMR